MAKDPAFLFYPGDWLGGTMGMDYLTQGCYLNLLILQFQQKGKFTEASAKHVLGISFAHAWPVLQHKFKTDGTHFWNQRLLDEIDKRVNYSKSRRNNALSKKNDEACAEHIENENDIENDIEKRKLKFLEELKIFVGKYPDAMIKKFADYWTEHNPGGRKMLYETKKVFDVSRRLARWNSNGYDKKPPVGGSTEIIPKDKSYEGGL